MGAGSKRRSTFPFGVNGNSSSITNADGTMNSANFEDTAAFIADTSKLQPL